MIPNAILSSEMGHQSAETIGAPGGYQNVVFDELHRRRDLEVGQIQRQLWELVLGRM